MFKRRKATISPVTDLIYGIPCQFVVGTTLTSWDGNFALTSRGGWVAAGEGIP